MKKHVTRVEYFVDSDFDDLHDSMQRWLKEEPEHCIINVSHTYNPDDKIYSVLIAYRILYECKCEDL